MMKPVSPPARKPLLKLVRDYHYFVVAIALNLPESLCQQRNQQRANRQFNSHVVRNHTRNLKRSPPKPHATKIPETRD